MAGQRAARLDPRRPRRRDLLALTALVAVAALLRFYRLGATPLWLDEALSYRLATAPLAELPRLLRLDAGPPLYYLALHGWLAVAGSSEAALRSLSAVASIALVVALYRVGSRTFGREVGFAAAFVAAWSPIGVSFAREARGYTLLSLLAFATTASLWRWLRDGRRRDLVAHAISLAAALYVHNYALFLLPTVALQAALARSPRRWIESRRQALELGLAWTAAVVAYLPWVPVLRAQLATGTGYAWMAAVWRENGVLGSLAASFGSLSPGGRQPPYVDVGSSLWGAAIPTVVAGILVIAGGAGLAGRVRSGDDRIAAVGVLIAVALPLLLALLASSVGTTVYLPGRLDQLVFPFHCLIVGHGVAALRRPAARAVALAVFALLALSALRPLTAEEPAGERSLAALLESRLAPGDAVVATSLTRAPLAYALRARPGLLWRSFPAELADHPGFVDLEALLAHRDALEAEAAGLLPELAADPAWSGRVFLLAAPDAVTAILVDGLAAAPRAGPDQHLGRFELSRVGLPVDLFQLSYRRFR